MSTYERLVNSQNFFSPYLTQEDLSRFGRNFLEMGNYLELILPLYGVRFISINDAFDSNDYLGVTGGLELALRNLINNMYSRDLSTKVRSAYRTRNLRGEYWGGSGFYGYQVHPHNKKRLIVDEQVRDIIVMIFESCVSGMTTSEVAQMLNDMGIPSPLEHKRRNGGFYNGVVKEETGIWLKGAVRKILTDERYTGKMITNIRETEEVGKPKMRSLPRDQWIIVPGTHEAIISEELFRAAQNALQGVFGMLTRILPETEPTICLFVAAAGGNFERIQQRNHTLFARKMTVLRVLSVQASLSIRPKLSKLFFRCCGNKVGASLSSIV